MILICKCDSRSYGTLVVILKSMNKLLVLILAYFLCERCCAQTFIFYDYQFTKGEYLLFAAIISEDSSETLNRSFYIDDPIILTEMKIDFQLNEIEPLSTTKRDWSYLLYIFKNKTSEMSNFEIGLNDKYIMPQYTDIFYRLDPEQIFKYKSSFKFLTERKFKYNSLQDGRLNYKSNIKNDSLVYIKTSSWVKFEGSFSFEYNCKNGDCPYKEPYIQENLEKRIKETYPNELFNLRNSGGSLTIGDGGTFSYSYTVSCNKSFADKFKLYPITEKYTNYSSFELTTYWKDSK